MEAPVMHRQVGLVESRPWGLAQHDTRAEHDAAGSAAFEGRGWPLLLAAEHPHSQFIAGACLVRARPWRLRCVHSTAAADSTVIVLMTSPVLARNQSLLMLGSKAYSPGLAIAAMLCVVVLCRPR